MVCLAGFSGQCTISSSRTPLEQCNTAQSPDSHGRVIHRYQPTSFTSFRINFRRQVVPQGAASRFQEALQHGGKGFKHQDKRRRCRSVASPGLRRYLQLDRRLRGLFYYFMPGALCSFPCLPHMTHILRSRQKPVDFKSVSSSNCISRNLECVLLCWLRLNASGERLLRQSL